MKPYSANLVADYVIIRLNADEKVNLINLKLQKLLYYIQAWYLGIQKEEFINCEFEAWVHGPVSRELYDRFKNHRSLYSFITISDVINKNPENEIDKNDIDFINYILDNYAGYSGSELELMTHEEDPWKNARAGFSPMQTCNVIITKDSMKEYYGKRWEEINK